MGRRRRIPRFSQINSILFFDKIMRISTFMGNGTSSLYSPRVSLDASAFPRQRLLLHGPQLEKPRRPRLRTLTFR